MPTLAEVCRHVRSKNAGPFWVTVDAFFATPELFDLYAEDPVLSAETFSDLYKVDASQVKITRVRSLAAVKISYPRPRAQGWRGERDMHSGQQFVPLLHLELEGKHPVNTQATDGSSVTERRPDELD